MTYELSDDEFERIRRAGRAGTTMTAAKAAAYGRRLGEYRVEAAELLRLEPHFTPQQLRRLAELLEIVEGNVIARPWWERAADAGDAAAGDRVWRVRLEDDDQ